MPSQHLPAPSETGLPLRLRKNDANDSAQAAFHLRAAFRTWTIWLVLAIAPWWQSPFQTAFWQARRRRSVI